MFFYSAAAVVALSTYQLGEIKVRCSMLLQKTYCRRTFFMDFEYKACVLLQKKPQGFGGCFLW